MGPLGSVQVKCLKGRHTTANRTTLPAALQACFHTRNAERILTLIGGRHEHPVEGYSGNLQMRHTHGHIIACLLTALLLHTPRPVTLERVRAEKIAVWPAKIPLVAVGHVNGTVDVQSRLRMASKRKRPDKKKATPGPKPDLLKLEDDWQDAVKKSLAKKKPAAGWPK